MTPTHTTFTHALSLETTRGKIWQRKLKHLENIKHLATNVKRSGK
jgi:hypothetical protein